MSEVDDLRAQLRERGYLRHGIERWFALDPWSSRTFWVELATVAAKGAVLIALFAALPMVAVMLIRNHPLTAIETLELYLLYAAAWTVMAFAVIVLTALLLKIRPELPIDTPRVLLIISILASGVLIVIFAVWWFRFDTEPATWELIAGLAFASISLIVTTIVTSAALLSFSIYEVRRVPAIHQRPRTVPLAIAAAVLIAIVLIPAYLTPEKKTDPPLQIVTTPTRQRVALVAVDGLTYEIAQSRPDLISQFVSTTPVESVPARSTTERWASIGTGVPASAHGVRSVDGVRLVGGSHVFQSVSRADFVLHTIAPGVGMARREPLPPTVRRRDYVWEVFAGRGLPSLAVNWWTSESARSGALTSIGQESIFSSDPLAVDATATRRFLESADQSRPQFATVYLPALDVVLNRLVSDQSRQLALSLRALDGVAKTVREIRSRGYDVILVGTPGEGGTGHAVIGSTLATQSSPTTALDLAPTLSVLLGFPASDEMSGRSMIEPEPPRVATYGTRDTSHTAVRLNQEYYESLRSLGYIR